MRGKTTFLAVLLAAALLFTACAPVESAGRRLGVLAQGLTGTPTTSTTLTPPGIGTPQPSATPTGEELPAPVTADESVLALQEAFQQVYDAVNPSVVNISSATRFRGPVQLPPGFPGIPEQDGILQGLGSGFVWDEQGHIVTNNHVVAGASEISVTFADGFTAPAEVVGLAPDADLAVIRVDAANLPEGTLQPVVMGDSSNLQVGQFVVAIGNPFGLQSSMTTGVISALGRNLPVGSTLQGAGFSIPNVIQTDASINPGNSGGVLVDIQGRVIGVNTAIESPVRGSVGVGFAIPANIVNRVVPALIEDGEFAFAYLGVQGVTVNRQIVEELQLEPTQRGFLVTGVTAGSPAEAAGLQPAEISQGPNGEVQISGGDIITGIDGRTVNAFEDLNTFLVEEAEIGQQVTLRILRDGQVVDVPVTLAARPKAQVPPIDSQRPGGVFLGITAADLTPPIAQAMDLPANQRGVLVIAVTPGSPAAEAGLQGGDEEVEILGQPVTIGGDVIIEMDGTPINNVAQLRALLNSGRPGDQVTLTILRDGEEQTVTVTLRAGGGPLGGSPTPSSPDRTPSPGVTGTPSPGAQTPSPGQTGSPTAGETPDSTVQPGGYLGILGLTMTPELAAAMELNANQRGVLVVVTEPGGPADQAGIQAGIESVTIEGADVPIGGDVIVAIEGQPVNTLADLTTYLNQNTAPGDQVALTVLRDGQEQNVTVTLGQRP